MFRWTPAGGPVDLGLGNGNVRVSADGLTVVADTLGLDGMRRASYWTNGTGWVQLPGLGGASGTSESTVGGVSSDGSVIVGFGWTIAMSGHGFRWSQATGSVAPSTGLAVKVLPSGWKHARSYSGS